MPRCLPVFHLLYLPSTNGPFFSLFDVWSFCFYKSRVFFFSYWSFLRIEVLCWNSREGVCFCLRESIRGRAERAVKGDKKGTTQYTQTIGKQTENIDFYHLYRHPKLTVADVYMTQNKQYIGAQTWTLHFICRHALGICMSLTCSCP